MMNQGIKEIISGYNEKMQKLDEEIENLKEINRKNSEILKTQKRRTEEAELEKKLIIESSEKEAEHFNDLMKENESLKRKLLQAKEEYSTMIDQNNIKKKELERSISKVMEEIQKVNKEQQKLDDYKRDVLDRENEKLQKLQKALDAKIQEKQTLEKELDRRNQEEEMLISSLKSFSYQQ